MFKKETESTYFFRKGVFFSVLVELNYCKFRGGKEKRKKDKGKRKGRGD